MYYFQIRIAILRKEFALLPDIEHILIFGGVNMSTGYMHKVCIICEHEAMNASEVAPIHRVVGWALFNVLK